MALPPRIYSDDRLAVIAENSSRGNLRTMGVAAVDLGFRATRQEVLPRVFLVVPEGQPSVEEYREHVEEMGRWLESRRKQGLPKVAVILDPRGIPRFNASLRKVYGDWRGNNIQLMADTIACAAYLVSSAFWRGVITAVFWVAKPVVPVQLFGERNAAIVWARTHVES